MASNADKFAERNTWVVIGVSEDEERWGNRIFRTLVNAGYDVHGVNPKAATVAGRTIHKTIADVPIAPEKRAEAVVDFVVHPKIGESVIKEAHGLGYRMCWLQPGAESDDLIRWGEDHGMTVVHHDCILKHYTKRDAPTKTPGGDRGKDEDDSGAFGF